MTLDSHTTKYRILVAEDETLIRMDLVEMLGEAGYEVVAEASNGEEAVNLAAEVKPDLAILDVKMPVLDGICGRENYFNFTCSYAYRIQPERFSRTRSRCRRDGLCS